MDQATAKSVSTQAVLRPFFRRPRPLLLLGTAAVTFVAGFTYKASRYRRNELVQRNAGPYVCVDRSGGGV